MFIRSSCLLSISLLAACGGSGSSGPASTSVEDNPARFDASQYSQNTVSSNNLSGTWVAVANRNYQRLVQRDNLWLRETGLWQRRSMFYLEQVDGDTVEIRRCANNGVDDNAFSTPIVDNKIEITTDGAGFGDPVYHFSIRSQSELVEQPADFATGFFYLDTSTEATPTVAHKVSDSTGLTLGAMTLTTQGVEPEFNQQAFAVNCFDEQQFSNVKVEVFSDAELVNKVDETTYRWRQWLISAAQQEQSSIYIWAAEFDGDKQYDTLKTQRDEHLLSYDHSDGSYSGSTHYSLDNKSLHQTRFAIDAVSIATQTQGNSSESGNQVLLQLDLDLASWAAGG